MSKKDQFDKNLQLTGKLADYVSSKPGLFKKHGDSAYVVFVEGDEELNKMNKNLLKQVKKEEKDKKVIAATLTKDKTNPWKFEFAF